VNPGDPVIERKVKPGGVVREYACTLAHRGRSLMVVRFGLPAGGAMFKPQFDVPPGSSSLGFFWMRRPFNLYRMRGPDGAVLGHRMDALTDVQFGADAVTYRDLALDWWVLADGTLIEEDRDEMDGLVATGVLSKADARTANEAARQIYSRYRHIIDDVAVLERRLKLAG
jgi:hypothetical protein